jgi:primosomal protein N' (replication factor Y)
MLYAKVVLGIPVEGPFDYMVPDNLYKKLKVGVRVWVPFRNRRMLGYVVGITRKTNIKNLKAIGEIIDEAPVLDKNMLSLTQELSGYYCCSWGEAIETALPQALRKGRLIQLNTPNLKAATGKSAGLSEVFLIHALDEKERWNRYIQAIKEALENNKSVIVLLPDINSVLKAQDIIKARTEASLGILYREEPRELDEWVKIKEGKADVIIATRSGIFAPVNNLGLIIIDEEQNEVYKQEQMPHYNCREVAFMRALLQKAGLILGSAQPSLESFYLARKNKIKYIFIPRTRAFPEIKIADTQYLYRGPRQKNAILSKYLEESIISTLNSKGKTLLFLNRKGFATFASCRYCGMVLKCPRCNINLVYYFKDNILNCHYCNFKMQPPTICPSCNSGYIRYAGLGTEKIESELSRLFPQAIIKRLDNSKHLDINSADIFISATSIIKETEYYFDLIAVLAIDNSLNRIDFRAAEKAFGLLIGLSRLTDKKIVIQTRLLKHHCFNSLVNKDVGIFYTEELKQRKQLGFPPYKHLAIVKLRTKKEERVKQASNILFNKLKKYKTKDINIISVNPGQPSKLRGNFYWQILIKSDNPRKISKFLKIHLKNFSHSGIIVTVDVDPI